MASLLKPNQKTIKWYLVKFSFLIIFFILLVGWYSLPSFSDVNNNGGMLSIIIQQPNFVKHQPMRHILSTQQTSVWFDNFELIQSSNSSSNSTEEDSGCDVSIITSNRTFAELCAYVRNPETDCNSNIYLQFLFCGLQYNFLSWIFYIFALVYLLFLFYLLGDTADGFFSPALIKISDYLRLSPNVAGVTLLALGNGSPDLSSIIIGVVRGSEGIGFGSPAGGGLFVTSFVYGCVCLLATFRLARRPYLRDVCFYLFAVCFALFLVIRRKVYIWESIFMILAYVFYVVVVIAGRFFNQRFMKKWLKKRKDKKQQLEKLNATKEDSTTVIKGDNQMESEIYAEDALSRGENLGKELKESDIEGSDSDSDPEDMAILAASGWKIKPSFFDQEKAKMIAEDSHSDYKEAPFAPDAHTSKTTAMAPQPSYMNLTKEQLARRYESAVFIPRIGIVAKPRQAPKDEKEAFVYRDYFGGEQPDTNVGRLVVKKLNIDAPSVFEDEDESSLDTWGKFKVLVHYVLRNIGWSERKWYQRISFILFEGICNAIRVLTIPRADPEEWNKFTTACIPIFSPIPIVFAIGLALNRYDFVVYLLGGVFPVIAIPIVIGFVLSILILATANRKKAPIYFPIFVIYAFFMSIVWIYIFASHLVSLIEAVGFSLSIPPSLLALTFLAWGNSAGDLIADISVARSGFPAMAVGGIFGAPILNLLFGIGVSFTLKILLPGKPNHLSNSYCVAFSSDPQVAILFIGCIINLLMSLLFVPICCKFRPIKCFGVTLILSYIIALIIAIVVSLWAHLGNVIFRNVILTPGQQNCNVFF